MPTSALRRIACLACVLFWSPALHAQPAAGAGAGAGGAVDPAPKTVQVTPAPDSQDAPPGAPQVVLTPQAEADQVAAAKAKADELAAEGRKLYAAGLYEQAIARFTEAHTLSRDPELLYSVAVSHQQLRNWEKCVEVMTAYIADVPPGPDPKLDRARTTRDLCEARIERDQELVVESQPVGARVFIDNRNSGARGQTPFRMYLRPGKHRVWVELDGYNPHMEDIEVQKSTPYRMSITLAPRQDLGWLFVDASVKDARVFIDGRSVGLTPLTVPEQLATGNHQVVVERDGYTRFNHSTAVERGQLTRVDAYLVQTESPTTWRTTTGVVSIVVGALAIGGGVTAYFFAEDEYNDTDDFDRFATLERVGYGVGGGLLAIGTSLIIWDLSRETIPSEHKNPDYGRPMQR
ncbi:MAG: PEGA domain-containing protein, partial [Myxococcales bacterium]|nr:PEGA domain-containing protein [Myxococcales bacterium]